MTRDRSASLKVVRIAAVCCASTRRWAIFWRMPLIRCRVSRGGRGAAATAGGGGGGGTGGGGGGRAGGGRRGARGGGCRRARGRRRGPLAGDVGEDIALGDPAPS